MQMNIPIQELRKVSSSDHAISLIYCKVVRLFMVIWYADSDYKIVNNIP